MNETCELLGKVYQNAKTAIDAIDMLREKTHSDNFSLSLEEQKREYHKIADEANLQLAKMGALPPESGFISRLQTKGTIWLNSINSQKTNRIAEVLINGSMSGIIQMSKMQNVLKNADAFSMELASRLISTERKTIELMQRFL